MARSAVLDVKVLVDAAQAAAGLNQVGQEAESMGSKLSKIGGAVAAAGIVAFAAKAVSAASDLQDAMGSVDSVFKDNADQIHEWAADTTDSIRLPQAQFEAFAASLGSQLKNAGVPMDQLAGKTKQLIQLGADLGAQSGQGTAAGVEALKAALKGETEQLENLNVNVTAAQISTEALALAHGDAAKAADPMIRQQATLNLIMEQSGDALGAAERESSNYASSQEHLNEVMTNLLAAVGAPLLDGLSGVVEGFANILPLVMPLVTGLAELVGWVLQLPTPLLLAVGGLVAWQVVGGLAGITSAWAAAVAKLTVAFKALSTTTIVGAVLTGIFLAMTALQSVFSDTDETIEGLTTQYDKWLSTLQDGKVTENTRETIALDSASSGLLQTYEGLGISTQAYIDASTGVAGGQEALAASVQQATNKLFFQGGVFDDLAGSLSGAVVSQQDFVDALASGDMSGVTAKVQAYADEQSALTGSTQTGMDIMTAFNDAVAAGKAPVDTIANATALAAQTAEKFGVSSEQAAAAQRALSEASGAAVDPVQALKKAVEDAKAAVESTAANTLLNRIQADSDAAARAADILKASLDAVAGRASDENAVVTWTRGMQDLGKAFTDTGGLSEESKQNLADWNVVALQGTKESQALYDSLTAQADVYPDLVAGAYDAAGGLANQEAATQAAFQAATDARAAFVAMAQGAGLTEAQAGALADKLGILNAQQLDPKVFELIAQDEAARAQLAALQAQGIDPKSITVTAVTDPATGEIRQVIALAEGATPVVDVNANPNPAESVVDGLVKDTNATTATTTTLTNTTPAAAAVTGLVNQTNQQTATITGQANVNPAATTVNQFTGQRRDTILTVGADTGPFQSAVSALIRDVALRQATLTVVAKLDRSQFDAAFNSLPTTRSVGAAPQLAAPAPALGTRIGATATSTGTVTAPIVINVTGALDPDAVARQIKNIVFGRDRRTGGVVVGRTRVGSSL